jgi:hypothetical protein
MSATLVLRNVKGPGKLMGNVNRAFGFATGTSTSPEGVAAAASGATATVGGIGAKLADPLSKFGDGDDILPCTDGTVGLGIWLPCPDETSDARGGLPCPRWMTGEGGGAPLPRMNLGAWLRDKVAWIQCRAGSRFLMRR